MNRPYSFEELRRVIPSLKHDIESMEREEAALGNIARPCGPLTLAEAREFLLDLVGAAESRPLTRAEVFLHGQLLCVYEQAVRAEMLGKSGRYFVIPEAALQDLIKSHPPGENHGPRPL